MTEHGRLDAEREICSISDVRAARVVVGTDDQSLSVRVLATPGRPVDAIVADVRAVALRSMGRLIDRAGVHVVLLKDADVDAVPAFAETADVSGWSEPAAAEAVPAGDDGPVRTGWDPDRATPPGTGAADPAPGPGPTAAPPDRITLDGVLAVRHGLRYTVEVTLHHQGRARTGSAMGAAASSVVLRLVTEATLDALAQFRPGAARLAVETTVLAAAGPRSVALVTLVLLAPSGEELLVGSAAVHDVDVHEAVARAALDATNRRLQLQA